MKLYEYMGKELFGRYGLPVESALLADSPEQARQAAEKMGPSVVKAQVLSGKRGKAGAISVVETPDEAYREAERILGLSVDGEKVERLLISQKAQIDHELYLAITVDGQNRSPLILASYHGGMDVEEVPEGGMIKWPVDVGIGFSPFIAREIAFRMGLQGELIKAFTELLSNLYRAFREADAELVEINPLVISGQELLAIDAKVTIDDDALKRQPGFPRVEEKTDLEKKAQEMGIAYVDLEGDIAVMANGAGITMATLDLVQHYGGTPANFLDFGGGAGVEKTAQAMELMLGTDPKVILVNIFGGITRCDHVAKAFATVKENQDIKVPVYFRLVGTNEDEGRQVLQEIGIEAYNSMEEAVRRAVEASKGEDGSQQGGGM